MRTSSRDVILNGGESRREGPDVSQQWQRAVDGKRWHTQRSNPGCRIAGPRVS